ncbi:MAG: hypothetical protein ACAI43_23850 [Phycisphaerae bacterium]
MRRTLGWTFLFVWRALSWAAMVALLLVLVAWWNSHRAGVLVSRTLARAPQTNGYVLLSFMVQNGRLVITHVRQDMVAGASPPEAMSPTDEPWTFAPATLPFNWRAPAHTPPPATVAGFGRRATVTEQAVGRGVKRVVRTVDTVVPFALIATSLALWPLSNVIIAARRRWRGRCPVCGGRRDRSRTCTYCKRHVTECPGWLTRWTGRAGIVCFLTLLGAGALAVRSFVTPGHAALSCEGLRTITTGGVPAPYYGRFSAGLARRGLELYACGALLPPTTRAADGTYWARLFFKRGPGPDPEGTPTFHVLGVHAFPDPAGARPGGPPPGTANGILLVIAWPTVLTPLALGSALWFVPALQRRRARRRRRDGRCPACDYDLRATPHRCPECGWRAPRATLPRALPETPEVESPTEA